jgi:hypothetical protein
MQKWSECGESFNGTLDDVDVEHHEYHPDSDHDQNNPQTAFSGD